MQVVDPVARAVVDPQLGHASPNGLDVTRIAGDEALDPGENLRPAPQITETRKPSDEPLCLADFNYVPTVAPWLRPRNAALSAPIKGNTAFEPCMGGSDIHSAMGCRCRPMQPMGSLQLALKGMRCNGSRRFYGCNVGILYGPGIAGVAYRLLYRKSGGLVTPIGP